MHNKANNQNRLGNRLSAGVLVAVFSLTIGFGAVMPRAASAQVATNELSSVPMIEDGIGDFIIDTTITAGLTAVGNAANYFATKMAYAIATTLVEGCAGSQPCFSTKQWEQMKREAYQGAVAHAIIGFADAAGLKELGLDICNPPDLVTLSIQLGLLEELKPEEPRCTLSELEGNWDEFYGSVESGEIVKELAPVFEPGQSPLSFNLAVFGKTYENAWMKERDAELKRLGEMMNGGWMSVDDAVSGRIISPSDAVGKSYQEYVATGNMTGDYSRSAMIGSAARGIASGIATNVINVFVQTLVAKSWNKVINGLLTAEQAISLQPDLVFNYEGLVSPPEGTLAAAFAPQVEIVRPKSIASYNPIEEFMSCPTDYRGPNNCVMDEQFALAALLGKSEGITVRDAIQRGYLHGDWFLISSSDKQKDQDSNCHKYAYCESNLKKLRAARVLPIGWEIAADKSPVDVPYRLRDVVNAFSDCNSLGVSDDEHPFCHLIDPDWVIKVPETQCRALGYNSYLLSSQVPTRQEQCVDAVTCLREDDQGNCVGGWGYCTKERNIWRFDGDSCPAYYNSCRTLSSATTGKSDSYLLNTMDRGTCSADNAGCMSYAVERNAVSCTLSQVCINPEGCLCELSVSAADKCTVLFNSDRCSTSNGGVCTITEQCATAGGCECSFKKTCLVQNGQQSCDSIEGDKRRQDDNWLASSKRFLSASVDTCNADNDGCTSVIPLAYGQSLNLIKNGSFEETTPTGKTAVGWFPLEGAVSGKAGTLSSDGTYSADGSNAAYLSGVDGCNIGPTCKSETDCPCLMNGVLANMVEPGKVWQVRLEQGGIVMYPGKTYTLSYVLSSGSNVPRSNVNIRFRDANGKSLQGQEVISSNPIIYKSNDGKNYTHYETSDSGPCARWEDGNYNGIVTNPDPGEATRYVYYACTFQIKASDTIPSQIIGALRFGSLNGYADAVQLEEGGGSVYHDGYGPAAARVNVKVAPKELGCTGEIGEPEECSNYAGVCLENEVGCERYTATSGINSPINAVATAADRCPAECKGYDAYAQEKSQFESAKYPVYMIPSTARTCSEADAGCSAFTNVETEEVGYFSSIRHCVATGHPTGVNTYYTWEGSDTTGYQLKTWRFLVSENLNTLPADKEEEWDICCQNGSCGLCSEYTDEQTKSDVCQGGECRPPCTKLSSDISIQDESSYGYYCFSSDSPLIWTGGGAAGNGFCSRADIDAGDMDCREFYDAEGGRHYRRMSKVIEESDNCDIHRIDTSTETDCLASSGLWEADRGTCIYRLDTEKSDRCSASAAGCRTYKGNTSGNVKIVFKDTFDIQPVWMKDDKRGLWHSVVDNPPADYNKKFSWAEGIQISNESIVVGTNSLRSGVRSSSSSGAVPDRLARVQAVRYVGMQMKDGRTYNASFYARGSGKLTIVQSAAGDDNYCYMPDVGNEDIPGDIEVDGCSEDDPCFKTGDKTPARVCDREGGCRCFTHWGAGASCRIANGEDACTIWGANYVSPMPVHTVELTSEWKYYTVGPFVSEVETAQKGTDVGKTLFFYVDGYDDSTQFKLSDFCTNATDPVYDGETRTVQATCGNRERSPHFWLDDVTLYEQQDTVNLIKDSWNTPASCDTSPVGSYSPQEMLGCKEYTDSKGNLKYLRSFTDLCRESAVGCRAYSHTQNTVDDAYAQTFNATCELRSTTGSTNGMTQVCGASSFDCQLGYSCASSGGCACTTETSTGRSISCTVAQGGSSCVTASRPPDNGVNCRCDYYSEAGTVLDACRVNVGETSCKFDYDGIDYQTMSHESPDRVVVPQDERLYLVATGKECQESEVACRVMAKPEIKYEQECFLKDMFDGGHPNRQPSQYDEDTGACKSGTCFCVVGFQETDTTYGNGYCRIPAGEKSCIASIKSGYVSGWAEYAFRDLPSSYGTALCEESEVGCDKFAASDAVYYLKNPGDKLCQYRTDVNIDGIARSGYFRMGESNKYVPCAPALLKGGSEYGIAKNSDTFCRLPNVTTSFGMNSGTCINPNGCDCLVNDQLVCRVSQFESTCGYEGWVGTCEAKYDRCEEFVDRMNTSVINPEGQPYYYIFNDKIDDQSCQGQVSLRQGCVALDRTASPVKTISAPTTYMMSARQNSEKVSTVACDGSTGRSIDECNYRCRRIVNGYCDSVTAYRHSCMIDAECPVASNGDAGRCIGEYMYGQACNPTNQTDCNVSVGEVCENVSELNPSSVIGGSCPLASAVSGSYRTGNDSNIVLKVRLDRECSEWLSCDSYTMVWDDTAGEYRKTCNSFETCNDSAMEGEDALCVSTVDVPRSVLREQEYARRGTSWYGEERSGYSLIDKYPIEYVQPALVPKKGCFNYESGAFVKAGSKIGICESDDDCGTDESCRQLSGICQIGENYLDSFCNSNNDCNMDNGEHCALSYSATHRFGVAFDKLRTCETDADCPASAYGAISSYGYSSSNGVTSMNINYDSNGSCVNNMCYWNLEGGKFNGNTDSYAACRAYPEPDAPYGPSVVYPYGSGLNESQTGSGYNKVGLATSLKENFASANVCTYGNDCECSYSKVTYGEGTRRFYSYPGDTGVPVNYNEYDATGWFQNAFDYKGICVGGPYDGKRCNPEVGSTDCGDAELGGQCKQWTKIQYYNGWSGFCVDSDRSMNRDGSESKFGCNLWLPVEQMSGAPDLNNQYRQAGFNPSQDKVFYCATAQNNRKSEQGDAGQYEMVIYDDTTAAFEEWNDHNDDDENKLYAFSIDDDSNSTWDRGHILGPLGSSEMFDSDEYCDDNLDDDSLIRSVYSTLGINGWGVNDGTDEGSGSGGCNREPEYTFSHLGLSKNNLVAFKVELSAGGGGSFILWPGNDWMFYYQKYQHESDTPREIPSNIGTDLLYPVHDTQQLDATNYRSADSYNCGLWNETSVEYAEDSSYEARCIGIKANFGEDSGKFNGFTVGDYAWDVGERVEIKITALLRENCTELQLVHDAAASTEPKFSNIAWTDRVYRGAGYDSEFSGTTQIVYDQGPTDRIGLAETSKDLRPYGRAAIEGLQENSGGGGYTLNALHPVPVWSSENGSRYTWLNSAGTDTSGNTLLNFGDAYPNDPLGFSVAGVPFGQQVNRLYPSSVTNATKRDNAIKAMGGVFARSWRSYAWEPTDDRLFEKGYAANDGGMTYDRRVDSIVDSGLEPYDAVPMVAQVDMNNCSPIGDALCRELTPDNSFSGSITVNNSGYGNLPGYNDAGDGHFEATIRFYAWADSNHMPIRRVTVDYGDGDNTSTDGYFRNHRGCDKDAETCDNVSSICRMGNPESEFGVQPQACEPRFFVYYHTYSCSQEQINGNSDLKLPSCDTTGVNPTYPCADEAKGECVFKPRVQVLDNWGYCNGSCPGGADGTSACYNRDLDLNLDMPDISSNGRINIDGNECLDITSSEGMFRWFDGSNVIQPWSEYRGEIRVKPGLPETSQCMAQ